MARRISLIVAIVAILSLFPARLSAQQNYVGLTLCSAELQSPHSGVSIGLDRSRHACVVYIEIPKARLVMIVVFREDDYQCGTVRDVREFRYSREVFDEECIEALHPENVAVGFFDQKFDPEHPERGALFRGPAVQSWRIDLNNLKFSPTSGKVTSVVRNLAGDDDGSDLAIWAQQRAIKTKRVIPMRTKVTFSSQSPENLWSVPIKSIDGKTVYFLSLVEDTDLDHHPITIELIMRRSGYKPDGANLLDPTGIRHGLQAYDFAADDLAQGVQKSAYGEKRTVRLKDLGLVVQIAVLKAAVSGISTGRHQIDSLELQIEVSNYTP